ncbi:hypothetical protein M378DRAFT_86540 [Amanita muscaria Koide BX008]|uniref:HAT C-terminal dimerisation domain-containing protein n=1 Tax=Amanita muscaria (strain Koide BX008) TaxID=946122 RepID=A0A0C2WQ80_AMAMK|nr:hypothetical protein M378DRAFT_86540 [Amanita muscaria Koide BX008]
MYPGLSCMARDYLSIPATSVDVEHIFSGGRVILSYLCNQLQVELTRALLCLGEWIKKGVVKDKDILVALKGILEMQKGEGEDFRL